MIYKQDFQNNKVSEKNKSALQMIECMTAQRNKENQENKEEKKMTYVQFIEEIVEKNIEQLGEGGKDKEQEEFSILEDLKLILELSAYEEICSSLFEYIEIGGKFKRNSRVLEKRYKDVLCKIYQNEMKMILKHVHRKGWKDYRIVNNQGHIQIQSKIKENDLIQLTQIVKRPLISPNYYPSSDQNKKTQQYYNSCCDSFTPIKLIPKHIKLISKPLSPIKNQLIQILKIQPIKTQTPKINPLIELQNTLLFYSSTFNFSMSQLLQCLDNVSGDLQCLDYYLEHRNQDLRWNQQQDNILLNLSDNDGFYQILLQRKGKENIETRKKYLLSDSQM